MKRIAFLVMVMLFLFSPRNIRASTLYTNGTAGDYTNAYNISDFSGTYGPSYNFMVSNSFTLGQASTLQGALVALLTLGETPTTLDWSIGSTPFLR